MNIKTIKSSEKIKKKKQFGRANAEMQKRRVMEHVRLSPKGNKRQIIFTIQSLNNLVNKFKTKERQ